ncbi:NAD(P)-dependent oxidoreductase [Oceanobacillus kapialis]|uniref:NAD(P)-dependent oxidoreductase n=1 Tax=Oceanobacillus kapialis TaxID=481353 RepID=UPI00384BBC24
MRLLLTGAFKYNEEQIRSIKSLGYEIIFIQDERLPLQMDLSSIDAVVCNSLFLYHDIRRFKKLEFIQLTSAGLDRVPLDYIKRKGIILHSAKGVYSIPMAEWVILKILEIYKNSKQFYEAQRVQKWEKHRDLLELTEKTIAIIGFGDVGKEIATRLMPFNVKLIGVGRRELNSSILNEYYLINNLDIVLNKSDIVILTIPHTNETNYLIDAKRLKNMKDTSILINVSRGGVIHEPSLIEFLKKGKFLGVALDVFEEEPLSKENPLWSFNRLLITPHNSFVSNKVNDRLFKLITSNLKENLNKDNF